jgi:gentisate 1,2-dioxygenase
MTDTVFTDVTGRPAEGLDFWEPLVIPSEQIDAEVDRLASLEPPANGRREALIVHPRSTGAGPGLAPGIQVTLSVLKPGERTLPIRHNSTQVNFCIRGGGHAVVDGRRIDFSRYDVWNHPSYRTYWHVNDGDDLQVRLTYSNAALLEKLNIHLVEENPPEEPAVAAPGSAEPGDPRKHNPFGTFELGSDGAMLMPYETLINPPGVESKVLHWPWVDVKAHLDKLEALGADYVGRRLYLLYNPMTGRTNGTTPNFFATMTVRPPGIVDRPHRHVSAAINYYFQGRGWSRVAGKRYEWKAGDLMLSAPGWAIHHHASYDDDFVYELTVQDQSINIAMESLLWQENLKRPPRVLGVGSGFDTNRADVGVDRGRPEVQGSEEEEPA